MSSIVITNAKRTAIGAFQGAFSKIPATDLAAAVVKAIKPDTFVDDVIMGCVLTAGLGQAPARQVALKAGLAESTSCLTINKVCGSGLKAIMLGHDLILSGSSEIVIAGGMENMNLAPHLLHNSRTGQKYGMVNLLDHIAHDGLEDAYRNKIVMGTLAEELALRRNYQREQQDAFAIKSLEKAKLVTHLGYFSHEIVKVNDVELDELPGKSYPSRIPQLRPAFSKNGTITPASASALADGAAACLLMHEEKAKSLNLEPLAKIIAHTQHAQSPDTFTEAPIGAIKKLLSKTGWSIRDVDLFEINEAFAVVTMATMDDLDIPEEKVNLHGGACALGHPIGASGARILVTLIHALHTHNKKRGVAAICIGGGEAVAIAIECA